MQDIEDIMEETYKLCIAQPVNLYYMIKIAPLYTPIHSYFQGFGDPDVYGYALGDSEYTNMVRANRVPEDVASWKLAAVSVSLPQVGYEDAHELLRTLVFSFVIFVDNEVKVLYAAPLFALPCAQGMSLIGESTSRILPLRGLGRSLRQFSGATEFGCRLTASLPMTLSEPVEVYIHADFAFYYEVGADTKGDGSDG